ncbi:MAG TPA: LLM class F420-dependent oxidoreductase [Ktedonobacterales bacterium]|nr:LLM class F420-dependent oxidoreductase [Ktedonobacterales bacterium]
MRLGAVFPQSEIGTDPAVIRDYAQTVEGMGYTHLIIYDHVILAEARPGEQSYYTAEKQMHEPFVLYGFLAAVTRTLELATGILILPQRQTVLVAKQAAEVDVLSGGRMRLGVAAGWNPVEFQALNEDFHTRGRRLDEQIALLRALWRDPVVTFHGRWHQIENAGINPLPVRHDIPIWVGGHSDAALRRTARLGNGWLPQRKPDERAAEDVRLLHQYTREAGRPEDSVAIEGRLTISQAPDEGEWAPYAAGWQALGATYFTVSTMGLNLPDVAAHIELLRRMKAALGPLGEP